MTPRQQNVEAVAVVMRRGFNFYQAMNMITGDVKEAVEALWRDGTHGQCTRFISDANKAAQRERPNRIQLLSTNEGQRYLPENEVDPKRKAIWAAHDAEIARDLLIKGNIP